MSIKPSYLVAGAIVLVVALYLVIKPFVGGNHSGEASAHPTKPVNPTPLVQVVVTPESQHAYRVTLRGRTQAARTVIVRSETSGVVAATPVLQGTSVGAGQVLCRLAVDARQASLDQ